MGLFHFVLVEFVAICMATDDTFLLQDVQRTQVQKASCVLSEGACSESAFKSCLAEDQNKTTKGDRILVTATIQELGVEANSFIASSALIECFAKNCKPPSTSQLTKQSLTKDEAVPEVWVSTSSFSGDFGAPIRSLMAEAETRNWEWIGTIGLWLPYCYGLCSDGHGGSYSGWYSQYHQLNYALFNKSKSHDLAEGTDAASMQRSTTKLYTSNRIKPEIVVAFCRDVGYENDPSQCHVKFDLLSPITNKVETHRCKCGSDRDGKVKHILAKLEASQMC